jgi:hypothetical protein
MDPIYEPFSFHQKMKIILKEEETQLLLRKNYSLLLLIFNIKKLKLKLKRKLKQSFIFSL